MEGHHSGDRRFRPLSLAMCFWARSLLPQNVGAPVFGLHGLDLMLLLLDVKETSTDGLRVS